MLLSRSIPLVIPRRSRASAARSRGDQAGFTLVELMVAMTGGLFISIVVFALSRDTSRFYQRETRVAHATLSGVSGFERLTSDLARAGHMSTPNITADPHVCNRPDASWPDLLENLRAVVVDPSGTSAAGTEVAQAGITPRAVIVSGALNTPEELHTRSVLPNGNGAFEISLNLSTPAAYRIGLRRNDKAGNQSVLQRTFLTDGVGKIVRLRRMGSEQYAVVAAVNATDDTAIVTLASSPQLVTRTSDDSVQCGLHGTNGQMGVSVIDIVRYELRSMIGDANYAQMYQASGVGGGTGGLPYEAKRAELVRVELDAQGTPIASTREIVGEYAVDLQLAGWRSSGGSIVSVDGDVLASNWAFTQQLRGLHVRLSVRSREADRELDVPGGGGGSNQDRYRMPLQLPDGKTTYARVRTFQADVPLRNLENATW